MAPLTLEGLFQPSTPLGFPLQSLAPPSDRTRVSPNPSALALSPTRSPYLAGAPATSSRMKAEFPSQDYSSQKENPWLSWVSLLSGLLHLPPTRKHLPFGSALSSLEVPGLSTHNPPNLRAFSRSAAASPPKGRFPVWSSRSAVVSHPLRRTFPRATCSPQHLQKPRGSLPCLFAVPSLRDSR